MVQVVKPSFDKRKTRETICRGRRSQWWRRKGTKSSGFRYEDASGKVVQDKSHLERINALVIPPAWSCVRVSPFAGSKLQAVGMDSTGRIQYLYHSKFSEKQQKKK